VFPAATPNEAEAACIASYDNWIRLRQTTRAPVVPIYHQGDHESWLYRYIEQGATYIGISPTDSFPTDVRRRWLYDRHWELEKAGVLGRSVFTHGFGVFSPQFMPELRGMMWSADASNIMRWSTMFRLLLPLDGDGEISPCGYTRMHPVYVGNRFGIAVSGRERRLVLDYLYQLERDDCLREVAGRIVIDDIYTLTSLNMEAVHRVMDASGVRCFIAGTDERVIRQVAIAERYPYILRSIANIRGGEKDCATLKKLYYRRAY